MTASVLDSLLTWTRRACGRPGGDGHDARQAPWAHGEDDETDGRTYRLRAWPDLPDRLRVAPVLRLLSTMTVRPVSRATMRAQPGLRPHDLEALLAFLEKVKVLVVETTAGPGDGLAARIQAAQASTLSMRRPSRSTTS